MSDPRRYTTHSQSSAYMSPWTLGRRIRLQAWEWCWALLCRWTPKPFNPWRLFWLKAFGAQIAGRPFVHARARVSHPWNLTLCDRACLGDGAHAYALGPIELQAGCTVAQEAYLCSATHDWAAPERPLQTAPIVIGVNAFVGLRAIVLPGITIGESAIIGAGAVVTRDVAPRQVVAGNPAKPITAAHS